MTPEEKQEACNRACGPSPSTHSLFCPYTKARWLRGESETEDIKREYMKESK